MPSEALKASWTVRAGVIPEQPIPERTKQWTYTSREHEEDRQHADIEYHSIFARRRAEAMDYYLQASMPHAANWADLVFIWY